jgi:SAM-dependent methyltransferase
MSKFGGYEDEPFLAKYYDCIPGYRDRPDQNFYLGYAQLAGGMILELGCGTGRILIPLVAAGYNTVGLDISPHMLSRCKQKLALQPEKIRNRVLLVQANMVDFELNRVFDLVITPFRSFQHLLSIEEQLACLRCINNHLVMGGTLILDLFQVMFDRIHNPKYLEEMEDFAETELPDGTRLRRSSRVSAFHRSEQYNDVELIYYIAHPDGRKERLVQAFPFRYFFRYEVEHLLTLRGFEVVDLYGNYDRSPLCNDSPEMIFVAKKCRDLR